MTSFKPTRRAVLKGGLTSAAALAAPALLSSAARAAAEQITVSDVGGAIAPALRKAFYDPFEAETGIKVVSVAQEPNPVTQIKLLVDTESYIWDVSMTTPDHVKQLEAGPDYTTPLELDVDESEYVAGTIKPNWLGFSVFSVNMALNTAQLPGAKPQSWADYWDVENFPGRRGLYRSPWGTLEMALLADGVAPADLYPLDVDRAFASLDKIREHVSVWWTAGAQNTQILQSGEVDMTDTWSARAYAAYEAGAPVEMVWDGLYSVDGWSVHKGTPRMEAAQEFVRFCARPEQQAIYSSNVANGPSAMKAYDFISEERATVLPTAPGNVDGLRLMDSDYWGANYDALAERFNEWLLMG
ncbi:ABC transporter substrate-binding protein [Salipiger mucosus]|uniref:Twin-arginine translocation pathway signal n=1 Tax=Salipiger mucosus DSM 16094 TaxID=1123237 RepID=S9RET5_9RHOB|nr:ABC transporter substrate-binding protein [Salipiger mucosus]EPX76615.1 Twin-arginine translocation pathway signal [Salipiger mucosus DSM 16094]